MEEYDIAIDLVERTAALRHETIHPQLRPNVEELSMNVRVAVQDFLNARYQVENQQQQQQHPAAAAGRRRNLFGRGRIAKPETNNRRLERLRKERALVDKDYAVMLAAIEYAESQKEADRQLDCELRYGKNYFDRFDRFNRRGPPGGGHGPAGLV